MGFFVLGVNHKACPVEIREKLYFSEAKLPSVLPHIKKYTGLEEILILSTCNRVEIYGYSPEACLPVESLLSMIEESHAVTRHEFSSYLYRYEGREAIRHFFRVAAGLDSLVVGENEILKQVREAFRMANQCGSVHSLLYRLSEKALKVGKLVRHETRINEGAVSISSVAVELAEKIFGKLTKEKVMVLGTGEMAAQTLKALRSGGAEILYIVSRNQEKGEQLAHEFGAARLSMEDWEKNLRYVDILITATSAPHPVVRLDPIRKVMQERRHQPLFIIDIAVPRDVETDVNRLDDVYLYNVDDLKGVADANLKLRGREIQASEGIVDKAVEDFQAWLEQLKARPTLERFERFLDEVLDHELNEWSRQTKINEEQKQLLRSRIRSKLMHPPLEKIKESSFNGGVSRYLEALHSLFNLDNKNKE